MGHFDSRANDGPIRQNTPARDRNVGSSPAAMWAHAPDAIEVLEAEVVIVSTGVAPAKLCEQSDIHDPQE